MAYQSFIVTASNPKSILFFIAFLPQFVSDQEPILPQMLILGGTFIVMAEIAVIAYALLANQARENILKHDLQRLGRRLSGGFLVIAGVITPVLRRPI